MTPQILRIVAAVTGSPLEQLTICVGRVTEDYCLHVTTLARASFAAALEMLPQALPPGFPRVAVLVDCSDWVGGPILARQMATHRQRRPWTLAPVQLVADSATAQPHGWRTDVPRRDVISALVDAGARGRLKIPASLPGAGEQNVRAGLKDLRARKDNAGTSNPNEDLALVVSLCAWVAVTRTPRRLIAGYMA